MDTTLATRPLESLVSGKIVDWITKLGERADCVNLFDFIVNQQHFQPNQLQIDLYDLLRRRYVWHIGRVLYKVKHKNASLLFTSLWKSATSDKTFLGEMKRECLKNIDTVKNRLNMYSYSILTSLKSEHLIDQDTYQTLMNVLYIDSMEDFERMKAPKGHQYEGRTTLDIVWNVPYEDMKHYYETRYLGKQNKLISRSMLKSDYANYYYEDYSPLGMDDMINKTFNY